MKLIAVAALVLVSTTAVAQTYPTKPLRFLVPFAPTGSADVMARLVGKRISEGLGQSVLIENQGGGGGTIAIEALARSQPDGYTVALGSVSTLSIAPLLNPNLRYDPLKSFAHISLTGSATQVLFVGGSVPAKDLRQLIELARAKPGTLNYGSNGIGAVPHLAGEMFKSLAGIDLVHVPYKGAGQVTTALLAGDVQLGFIVPTGQEQNLQTGRLRALAVAGPKRLPSLPDVPTSAEAGLPGLQTYTWFGMSAAHGTPAPIVTRLNAEINRAVADKELQDTLIKQGVEARASTPQEYLRLVVTDTEKWSKIIKSAGITLKH
jgi:tripartite-type tricarboxylate transporter receptor subunit TctC